MAPCHGHNCIGYQSSQCSSHAAVSQIQLIAMLKLPYHLILASGSPRRKQLLEALGFTFSVRKPDIREVYPADLPKNEVAKFLAKSKAEAMRSGLGTNELAITADTTVVHQGYLLEKAQDAKEAAAMLSKISGETHQVITGVSLLTQKQQVTFDVTTEVIFRDLTEAEIDWYVQHYSPFDKAGAYGIQEWIGMVGVKELRGCYYNVMGLPLHRLYEALRSFDAFPNEAH